MNPQENELIVVSRRPVKSKGNFMDNYRRIFNKSCREVTIIVTHDCNLRCSYCYETSKSNKKMTIETGKAIVDLLFKTDAENGTWINPTDAYGLVFAFIGGEPLLEIELIDAFLDYFLEQAVIRNHRWMTNYMISMSTNGTLYRNENVQKFINKWTGRLSIGVTVDGDKETHDRCRVDVNGNGSYDLSADAFRSIRDNYGQDGTKITISPSNVHNVFNAVTNMVQEFDLSVIMINCVYEEGWKPEHASILYEQLKLLSDWMITTGRGERTFISFFDELIGAALPEDDINTWCGGTGKMTAFDTNGDILPCVRYSSMALSNQPPIVVGNLTTGIGNTAEHARVIAELESVTRLSQSTEKCFNCSISKGCGYCSAYNYDCFGTPNSRATFTCQMHQARVLACVYHFNNLYRKYNVPLRFMNNVPYEWAKEIISEEEIDLLATLQSE